MGDSKLSKEDQDKIKESIKQNIDKPPNLNNGEKKGFAGHSFIPQPKLNEQQRFDNLLKLKEEHDKQTGKKHHDLTSEEKRRLFQKFQNQITKMGFGSAKDRMKAKKDL